VLIGNGILAFLWYFNGAYHDVTPRGEPVRVSS
jgi:hypothetical protein